MQYIVIPTYWTGPSDRAPKKEDLIFDHPTPLDGKDTLTASLESLSLVKSAEPFRVLIITAAVHPELAEQVEAKVESLIAPFRGRLEIGQFSYSALNRLRDALRAEGIPEDAVSLEGYSAIRNCQLLAPALLGATRIAAIDDDELVQTDFSDRTGDFAGKDHEGRRVHGVAGRYFYEWGSFYVREKEGDRDSDSLFRKKQVFQNDSYRSFDEAEGRLVPTTIALGGNMVFTPELFRNVPFDPAVTRGEDIDYLINSMMYGYRWMMDKELRIDHFPPPCRSSAKLQEDVIRFIYEREKIRWSVESGKVEPVTPEMLGAYPGNFLKDDLDEEALRALKERPATGNEEYYLSPEEVLSIGRSRAEDAHRYHDYVLLWRRMIDVLGEDTALCAYLEGLFG